MACAPPTGALTAKTASVAEAAVTTLGTSGRTLSSLNRLQTFSIQDFGAVGDGRADDTASIKAAIESLQQQGGGSLFFPSGTYLVTDSLVFNSKVPVELIGAGWTSTIVWGMNEHLFRWSSQVSCREVTVKDLKILSGGARKSPEKAAFLIEGGAERATFDHLILWGEGSDRPGSGIRMIGLTDTVTISNCQFWGIQGTAVEAGQGSELRLLGGRIVGTGERIPGSIGLLLTGGNGGVHVIATDFSGLYEGVRVENSSGAGSNRELMLTHASIDACWRGLSLLDNCYVSVIGCWTASCDHENIYVAYGLSNPVLVVSGGTIYNAGVLANGNYPDGMNGIVVNSGTFQLTGVSIRNNRGRAVWVPNSSVREYTITGCRITDNRQALALSGSDYAVTGNVCVRNSRPSEFTGSHFVRTGNVD